MTCGLWSGSQLLSALMLSLVAHTHRLKSEPCGIQQIVYCLVSDGKSSVFFLFFF